MELFDIAPQFSFTEGKGMLPESSSYSPHDFGNAQVVLRGELLALRFTQERGQIFVDVAGDKGAWFRLEDVLALIDISIGNTDLRTPTGLTAMARALQENWQRIAGIFSDPQQMLRLEAFTDQNAARQIEDIFGTE